MLTGIGFTMSLFFAGIAFGTNWTGAVGQDRDRRGLVGLGWAGPGLPRNHRFATHRAGETSRLA